MWFHSTPSNWDQFLVSFWASLISGAIYSAIIGIVIGVALFKIQTSSDARRMHSQYAGELEAFKERLRYVLRQPWDDAIHRALDVAVAPAEQTYALTDGPPINLWRDNLSHEGHFFDALRSFQRAFVDDATISRRLDINLNRVLDDQCRAEKSALIPPTVPLDVALIERKRDAARAYSLCRLAGLSEEYAAQAMTRNDTPLPYLRESYQAVTHD